MILDEAAQAAVMKHMNDDHAEDSLLIVRGVAGVDDATDAVMTGLDEQVARFRATTATGTQDLEIPWPQAITARPDVRVQVVKLYEQACAALEVPVRPH